MALNGIWIKHPGDLNRLLPAPTSLEPINDLSLIWTSSPDAINATATLTCIRFRRRRLRRFLLIENYLRDTDRTVERIIWIRYAKNNKLKQKWLAPTVITIYESEGQLW